MNPWRWVDPRIRSVRLDGVRGYLEARGWRLGSSANPNFLRYEPPSEQNGSLPPFCMIPSSERLADFAQSITYLITTLSEMEDRHPVAVLEDVLEAQGEPSKADPAAPIRGAKE